MITPKLQERTVRMSNFRTRLIALRLAFFCKDFFVMGLNHKNQPGYIFRYDTPESLETMRKYLNQATAKLNHLCKTK